MSALDQPLREQAGGVASGEIDAGELLDACLARIEERNPDLNAIVATFPDRSRAMLEGAPEGPLHGVPVVIKDEWPLPWRAERVGAAAVPGVTTRPGESGPYRALRDAGAVIAGVANMHELGSSSTGNTSVYGAAHNPWDRERCPGGSSSGPGASVAGGLVSGAVGADGLGSIRYPAAYCGLTGLKPTFGRSAMEGHHIPNTETIVSGPLCRDAADCRLLASVMFGEAVPAALGEGARQRNPFDEGLRIGVVRDPYWSDCTPGVREACESALESLRADVDGELTEVPLPHQHLILPAAVLVAQAEEAAHLTPRNLNALPEELGLINRSVLKLRGLIPGSLAARAFLVRAQVRRELAELFEHIDLLAWPTVPAVAPPLAEPTFELPSGPASADAGNARQGVLANLTGVPGVSVPVGLDEGLPVGLQLLAAWGQDGLLLDAAEALEGATDREFVELRPTLRQSGAPTARPSA
jgi:Asp-tRNA(Asn)/Glu-tRNA(Gln) amidotransferase A subunit family amidase